MKLSSVFVDLHNIIIRLSADGATIALFSTGNASKVVPTRYESCICICLIADFTSIYVVWTTKGRFHFNSRCRTSNWVSLNMLLLLMNLIYTTFFFFLNHLIILKSSVVPPLINKANRVSLNCTYISQSLVNDWHIFKICNIICLNNEDCTTNF